MLNNFKSIALVSEHYLACAGIDDTSLTFGPVEGTLLVKCLSRTFSFNDFLQVEVLSFFLIISVYILDFVISIDFQLLKSPL